MIELFKNTLIKYYNITETYFCNNVLKIIKENMSNCTFHFNIMLLIISLTRRYIYFSYRKT